MTMRAERRALLKRCRLLSALRRARFGTLPVDPDEWWKQITELAAEHEIELPTFEQWVQSSEPDQWEMPV